MDAMLIDEPPVAVANAWHGVMQPHVLGWDDLGGGRVDHPIDARLQDPRQLAAAFANVAAPRQVVHQYRPNGAGAINPNHAPDRIILGYAKASIVVVLCLHLATLALSFVTTMSMARPKAVTSSSVLSVEVDCEGEQAADIYLCVFGAMLAAGLHVVSAIVDSKVLD